MKPDHVILGVHVTDRTKEAVEVQKLLTHYGSSIKTRLGLHEIGNSPEGVMVLEVVGNSEIWKEMAKKLSAIEGIEVKEMVFGH